MFGRTFQWVAGKVNYENVHPNIIINILDISHELSYFKMFIETFSVNIIKYDSACEIS